MRAKEQEGYDSVRLYGEMTWCLDVLDLEEGAWCKVGLE